MTLPQRESHLKLTLREGPSATRELRGAIEAFAGRNGLTADERFDLKLAATEALTNALKGSPEPHVVEATLKADQEAVEVEVFDRGVFSPLRAALARGSEAEGG